MRQPVIEYVLEKPLMTTVRACMPSIAAIETCGRAAVGQLAVNLIRKNDQVMFLHDLDDRLEMLAAHDGAGRVVRVRRKISAFVFSVTALSSSLRGQAEFISTFVLMETGTPPTMRVSGS